MKYHKNETLDDETGEYTLKQFVSFDDDCQPWKTHFTFVKVFPKELKKFKSKLTSTDLFIIIDLLPHISYKSGMLTVSGKNDVRCPLLTKHISEITGFSKRAVLLSLGHMVELKLISRNKTGKGYQYFVNPHVFFKGAKINDTLIAMFKDYEPLKNEEGCDLQKKYSKRRRKKCLKQF